MNSQLFKQRTKKFAVDVLKFASSVPKEREENILITQLIRSSSSVGANYRTSCRARSPADFIAKMGIVEEEADETIYWMELLIEAGFVAPLRLQSLLPEANELLAMTVTSIKTAKRNK
jgi:four helix bundle protein